MTPPDVFMRLEVSYAWFRGLLSGLGTGLAVAAIALIEHRMWTGVAVFAVAGACELASKWAFRSRCGL